MELQETDNRLPTYAEAIRPLVTYSDEPPSYSSVVQSEEFPRATTDQPRPAHAPSPEPDVVPRHADQQQQQQQQHQEVVQSVVNDLRSQRETVRVITHKRECYICKKNLAVYNAF